MYSSNPIIPLKSCFCFFFTSQRLCASAVNRFFSAAPNARSIANPRGVEYRDIYMDRKLLIIDVAALSWDLLQRHDRCRMEGLSFAPAQAVFPAVTCTAQASFRTASAPGAHGMVANGLYFPELRKAMFWEQASALVAGERIWAGLRRAGGKAAMLFWQQSMGEQVDIVMTPGPIHKHHGGMIQDCYCRPDGLYKDTCDAIGSAFKLRQYWGPLASARVGEWIARATARVLTDPGLAPEVCMTYLPTLDYDLQRHGPHARAAAKALDILAGQLRVILQAAAQGGYETIIFGDYAIAPTTGPAVLPNLALAREGLLATRNVRGMLYPDFHTSRALAIVDHEIAHVHTADAAATDEAKRVLEATTGIAEVLDADAQAASGLCCARSGQLVAVAAEGTWLAYPWWADRDQAPDYATHVDIHSKPGFDPCELFFGWPPLGTSLDTSRIRGSHGRVGPGREIAWASTLDFPLKPTSLLDLAGQVKRILDQQASE